MRLTLKDLQAIVEQTMAEMDKEKERQPAVKQQHVPELSDQYYASLADKLYQDYGRNSIEDAWEEAAISRFCASVKATSHVDIDRQRLKKALEKRLELRDKNHLEPRTMYLREVAHRLRIQSCIEPNED